MSSARKLLYSIHDPFHPYSPICFLDNVSSLILSWLLILSLPTHCTKVKDTVHYYTVTYMLLIRRRLDDLFSYKNIVNSNSQYLALQHVLFIYRDGTMALARTSGQVLTKPWQQWLFSVQDASNWNCRRHYSCCLPADPPAHGRQKERMVNYIFVRTLAWLLPTMNVHVGIAVLGTDMPKLMNKICWCQESVDVFIINPTAYLQINWSFVRAAVNKCWVLSISCSPLRAQKFHLMAGIHWHDSLYPSTKPAMDPPGKTLCIWPTWTPEIK